MGKRSVPALPVEVVICILSFVAPSSLLSVILASHSLRKLAEPFLYRHIDLSNCPTRCLYLFRTLLSRKDLCKHVRTFQPSANHTKPNGYLDVLMKVIRSGSQEHLRRTAYIQHAERVATRLVNVENISVHTSSEQALRALGGLSHIRKFRTLHPWGLRQHELLLDAIPNVTHLELPFTSFFLPVSEIKPYHTPLVEELICPTNVAIRLVPGRPIKRLFLLWPMFQGPPNSYELVKEMARSTETIKALGLFVGWGWHWQGDMAEIVSAVATFLPDVEELTLKLKCWKSNAHVLHFMLQQLPNDLESLHKLRVLDFNGSVGYGVDYFDHRRNAISAVYTRILHRWASRCPTLEKVIFPNGAVWIKERTTPTHPIPRPYSPLSASKRGRPLPHLTLAPFRRSSISQPLHANDDITSLEDKDVHHLDHAQGNLGDNDDVPGDEALGSYVDLGLETTELADGTRLGSGSGSAAHESYQYHHEARWRCLNPLLPRSNRTTHSFFSRIEGAESWSEPMFRKDVNKAWPEGLWSGTAP